MDYDMWLGPAPRRAFNRNRFHFNSRWFWDYAGGLMTNWGVHMLNIVFWALGEQAPRTVTSTGGILAAQLQLFPVASGRCCR
jgi:predicted dehydrogenase